MRWTERQRAILLEMGLQVWGPERPQAAIAPALPASRPTAPPPEVPAATVRQAVAADVSETAAPTGPATPAVPAEPAEPATAATAVAAMDWPQLRATVAGCRACSLCERRTNTVFGVGNEQADWMIVGEAPGEQEDLKGEPFVGAAGQLLDRMLAALGLTRSPADPAHQVFIANTLKCRPPGNRNPHPEELARCQPYLERQLELVQPRVILAMGRFAVNALLASTEAIGRLRGRVHLWRGRPLVVTYHPAYLLRTPADKARAWADLCLAASVLERG